VNHEVEENPFLVWKDPYRRGWLIIMQRDHQEESSALLSGERAKDWFSTQATNLVAHLVRWTPNSLPKGELLVSPRIRKILQDKWNYLKEFLLEK
jgi:hypothetical protein